MNQHTEVPQLLRYFMRGRRKPTGNAQPNIDKKGSGDRQATQEIVQAIPDEYEISQWLFAVAVGSMTVVPVQQLLQQEKNGETSDYQDSDVQNIANFNDRSRDPEKPTSLAVMLVVPDCRTAIRGWVSNGRWWKRAVNTACTVPSPPLTVKRSTS